MGIAYDNTKRTVPVFGVARRKMAVIVLDNELGNSAGYRKVVIYGLVDVLVARAEFLGEILVLQKHELLLVMPKMLPSIA